jgi:hypothetical protein
MGSMELLGHHQDQRVGVFVDTQNLYHSARDYYERNVNFESLLRFAVGGRRLVRATAYVVEKEGTPRPGPFIYKLSTIGYRVRRMYLTVKETGEGGGPSTRATGTWASPPTWCASCPTWTWWSWGAGTGTLWRSSRSSWSGASGWRSSPSGRPRPRGSLTPWTASSHLPEIPNPFMEPKNTER